MIKTWKNWLWPVVGIVSLLVLWHVSVVVFQVKTFVAPSPLAVVAAVWTNRWVLLTNLRPTALEAISGFALGNTVAVILATIFVHSQTLRRMYFPAVVIFNTIPIIALSPILILIFGLTVTSKVIIAAIICLFPTLVNMIRGFEAVSASELELMRIMAASRREVFFRLRLPRSLPFLFSALRIASTTCVIGAIVSEWIGAQDGIGVLIIQSTFEYRTELLYASIVTSSALALTLFGIVALVEASAVRWRTN
jgi:NitT/TauT family transport system permease protein